MEIKSNSPITNLNNSTIVKNQQTEKESSKSTFADTVTISAEAQALSDEITPKRGGGGVIIPDKK